MADDLSQLDALIESDILEALGEEVPEELKAQEDNSGDSIEDILNAVDEVDETTKPQNDLSEIESILGGESIKEEESDNVTTDSIDTDKEIDDIGDIEILPMAEIESALDEQQDDNTDETISMNSNDLGSLANILSKLLNNKTIEITIKIRD